MKAERSAVIRENRHLKATRPKKASTSGGQGSEQRVGRGKRTIPQGELRNLQVPAFTHSNKPMGQKHHQNIWSTILPFLFLFLLEHSVSFNSSSLLPREAGKVENVPFYTWKANRQTLGSRPSWVKATMQSHHWPLLRYLLSGNR